jgi:hypothetical protein
MRENRISAPPEIESEVARALEKLKKQGYVVQSENEGGEAVVLVFQLGETEQRIKFGNGEWRNPGTVEQRIIDKLEI